MEGYPTNPSQPQLPEGEPKREKVKATEVKKSKFSKMLENMLDEDLPSLKKYVVMNVLLPRIGKMLLDIFNLGPSNGTTVNVSGDGKTDYNAISSTVRVIGSSGMTQPYKDQEITKRYSFKQLGYSTEREALDVLDQLRDDIDRYQRATLLSYYEYSDVATESTESNWGWKDLSMATVVFDPGSQLWIIRLPKVQYVG